MRGQGQLLLLSWERGLRSVARRRLRTSSKVFGSNLIKFFFFFDILTKYKEMTDTDFIQLNDVVDDTNCKRRVNKLEG